MCNTQKFFVTVCEFIIPDCKTQNMCGGGGSSRHSTSLTSEKNVGSLATNTNLSASVNDWLVLHNLSKYILYNYQCRKFITCYVGALADDLARSMRELKISSLISCEPGTSDITQVSSVLSRVSRQMGHVLLFTFL